MPTNITVPKQQRSRANQRMNKSAEGLLCVRQSRVRDLPFWGPVERRPTAKWVAEDAVVKARLVAQLDRCLSAD